MIISENPDYSVSIPENLLNLDQIEEDPEEVQEESEDDVSENSVDYSSDLADIKSTLENIEVNQLDPAQLQLLVDNSSRLYYFTAGLYVAFAIVLAIKFLKIFF